MTVVDRILRRWRESKVRPHLHQRARVLDIGCADGNLFRHYRDRFATGIGIDPGLERSVEKPPYRLIAGAFPEHLHEKDPFDVVSLLAVLEHVPPGDQPKLARDIAAHLKSGGHVIVTVPSPHVDRILDALRTLRVIHGMSLEQHYGFPADQTPRIFESAGLRLVRWRRFQLGLNNLFVFRKP
jgi:2-polyprenyl-3-methyl-5-hydroxy-6-metoxy-1,4-benzoquinol methylase